MKLLTSTNTKPQIPSDFTWTKPGELLYFGFVCDNACTCGCGRSLVGMDSQKATTLFQVADVPIRTRAELTRRIATSLRSAGWHPSDAAVKEMARDLVTAAEPFAIGDLLRFDTDRKLILAAKMSPDRMGSLARQILQ